MLHYLEVHNLKEYDTHNIFPNINNFVFIIFEIVTHTFSSLWLGQKRSFVLTNHELFTVLISSKFA